MAIDYVLDPHPSSEIACWGLPQAAGSEFGSLPVAKGIVNACAELVVSQFAGRDEEAVELRSTGQPRAAVPT